MTHWNSSFLSDLECHFSCTWLPLLCKRYSLFTLTFRHSSRLRIACIHKVVSLWFCCVLDIDLLVIICFLFLLFSLFIRIAHLFYVCLLWEQFIELLKRIVEFIWLERFCLLHLNNFLEGFCWLIGRHKFYLD